MNLRGGSSGTPTPTISFVATNTTQTALRQQNERSEKRVSRPVILSEGAPCRSRRIYKQRGYRYALQNGSARTPTPTIFFHRTTNKPQGFKNLLGFSIYLPCSNYIIADSRGRLSLRYMVLRCHKKQSLSVLFCGRFVMYSVV